MTPRIMSKASAEECDCQAKGSLDLHSHEDLCLVFACWACKARIGADGVEHAADCLERCPWCGSEGRDNDHVAGCPTINTCAQCYPHIPKSEGWHNEPDDRTSYAGWIDEHLKTMHPTVSKWASEDELRTARAAALEEARQQ